MAPKEDTALLTSPSGENVHHRGGSSTHHEKENQQRHLLGIVSSQFSFSSNDHDDHTRRRNARPCTTLLLGLGAVLIVAGVATILRKHHLPASSSGGGRVDNGSTNPKPPKNTHLAYLTGPYKLSERHVGDDFFKYYTFYDGADSLGSAGYNVYVGKKRAEEQELINVTSSTLGDNGGSNKVVYMKSKHMGDGKFRESVRLEGKKRFNSGLFIMDLDHMPTGCGVWPAFWLTDEDVWPYHGEIDIVEGINVQTQVKTALHTSDQCDMYAHVSKWWHTGTWDRSTGIPDTYTGELDFNTSMPADNCWVMAPHQWQNQGCVMVHDSNQTLGAPINKAGGAVYILEWDPASRYIRSWVFRKDKPIPANLKEALASSSGDVRPDPMTWGLPFSYFAIGEGTGCSADHFQNMRVVVNLAFCGTVAGNRFGTDCPAITKEFAVHSDSMGGAVDPVATCNAYVASNPKELDEAYWKIRGIYVYEREANHTK